MFLGLALLLSGQAEAVATWSADKRFKDNGNKTITDTKTGLMWMKNDSYLILKKFLHYGSAKRFLEKMNKQS